MWDASSERAAPPHAAAPRPGLIWVVAEIDGSGIRASTLEVLGEAVAIARPQRPGVVAVGPAAAEPALARLTSRGAGPLVLLEGPADVSAEAAGCAVSRWLVLADGERRPPVLLVADSHRGRPMAARIAVDLDGLLVPGAVALRRGADATLRAACPAYGDRLDATVELPAGRPTVVTFREGALGIGPAGSGPSGTVERRPVEVPAGLRTPGRRRVIAADPRTVDVAEAERIVAGGGGVGSVEGFRLLGEVAEQLGASIAGSRVAVDRGWVPSSRQVGQSGRVVSPDLYLAFGISGASQHLAGMATARTIVAVNSDGSAPLSTMAHLAVVGNWQPIAEALLAALQARHGPSAEPAGRPP